MMVLQLSIVARLQEAALHCSEHDSDSSENNTGRHGNGTTA